MIKRCTLALIISLLLGLFPSCPVEAARGLPGSPEFGYGAWIHPYGADFNQGLALQADLNLDWIGVIFDWAAHAPVKNTDLNFSHFNPVFLTASRLGTPVVISITNPPDWALTGQGPDPSTALFLIDKLITAFPGQITAIELFPGANLKSGWKADPNPADYMNLYAHIAKYLQKTNSQIELIAAGLSPLPANPESTDQDDLLFLCGLYKAGAAREMRVISIRFPTLAGDPLTAPSEDNKFAFRRYEKIRQVMLDHNHQNGLLWITLINPPDGKINPGDAKYQDLQKQAEWLQQAIIQARGQLYIGAVMINNLNTPAKGLLDFTSGSLILEQNRLHPFYNVLKALIEPSKPESAVTPPGRPKGTTLLKCKNKT